MQAHRIIKVLHDFHVGLFSHSDFILCCLQHVKIVENVSKQQSEYTESCRLTCESLKWKKN